MWFYQVSKSKFVANRTNKQTPKLRLLLYILDTLKRGLQIWKVGSYYSKIENNFANYFLKTVAKYMSF